MRLSKGFTLAAAAVCLTGLTSCSLLPQEEEYTNKPVIRSYAQAEYDLSYAQYGDVTLTETISLKYMAVSTQALSFTVGGEYYGEIFVQKGDLVTKGQLLAELDLSNLEEDIADDQSRIDALETDLRHTVERRDLAVASQRKLLACLSAEEAKSAATAEDVEADYASAILSIEDSLSIARMRLAENERELSSRRLYAGIDGAVTYVRSVEEGDKCVEGETFIRLADATNSVFSGVTANYALLPAGSLVSIYSQKEYLDAVVVTAEELSLPDEGLDKKGRATVYFRLLAPNAALETGDRGTLTLVLAEAKDVLYVPVGALHSVGEQTFVYTKDEQGLKSMRYVETGLIAAKTAEIRSGLSQGDNVILD